MESICIEEPHAEKAPEVVKGGLARGARGSCTRTRLRDACVVVLFGAACLILAKQVNRLPVISGTDAIFGSLDSVSVGRDSCKSNEGQVAPLVQQAETGCWRKCSNLSNVVALQMAEEAGYSDRTWLTKMISNMGQYLCAKIVVPPPHLVLHPRHNFNVNVSSELTWADLLQTGTLNPLNHEAWLEEDRNYPAQSAMITSDHVIIDSMHENTVIEDFLRAEALSAQGKPFAWRFHFDANHAVGCLTTFLSGRKQQQPFGKSSPLPSLSDPPTLCTYTFLDESKFIYELRDRAWDQLMQSLPAPDAVPVFLHVRRGDAWGECNTKIPLMDKRLACSLEGCSPSTALVMLFSDETKQSYRDRLRQLVERNGVFVDGDAVVLDVIRKFAPPRFHNNFVVYAVARLIDKRTSSRIQVRRNKWCHECDPVLQCRKLLPFLPAPP